MTDLATDSVPQVLSSWTRVLLDALNDKGYAGLQIAQRAGLDVDDFSDPNASFSISQTTAFWEAASEATGDSALGLWVSRYAKPTSFHALGFATLASQNLLDAFNRMARYSDVISDVGDFSVEVTDETISCILVSRSSLYPVPGASIDALFSQIIRFSYFMTESYEPPRSVRLMRLLPEDLSPYQSVFNCPVEFGAAENRIIFDRAFAEKTAHTANSFLARQHDKMSEHFLKQVKVDPFTDRLRRFLVERLPSGEVNISDAAKEMAVSVRSLQRWLRKENQSFSGFLAHIRQEQAKHYLSQTDIPITEIAFLLGFSDSSTLSRNFKVWTGQSPSDFRAQ